MIGESKGKALGSKSMSALSSPAARQEIQDLQSRLQELEETIAAIRSGAVDALVVSAPEGDQVYTLRGAEHPYRVFFETMNEGGAVISREGLILACNQSFEQLVAVELSKLFGSSFYDFVPAAEHRKIKGLLKNIVETKAAADERPRLKTETVLLRTGGHRVPVQLALSAIDQPEELQLCLVITDLSKQKQAEAQLRQAHDELELKVSQRTLELENSQVELRCQNEELRQLQGQLESNAIALETSNTELEAQNQDLVRTKEQLRQNEERLQLALEAAELATWDLHLPGGEAIWNQSCYQLLGYRPDEVQPGYQAWRSRVYPEDLAATEAKLLDCLEKGGDFSREYRLQWPDGSIHWVEARGRSEHDAAGRALRSYGVVRNITERKRTEAQLEQLVEERTAELKVVHSRLLHSEKLAAIGKLSASIAHEFNNPLCGIQNVIEGIKRNVALEKEERQLLELALTECGRVKNLIRGLQDFHRPSSGKQEPIDLNRLLDDLLVMAKKEFKDAMIDIKRQYDPDLPQVKGVADQLKQVFLNLLTNAKDAIKGRGTVTIITEHLERQLAVHISDTGSGITDEGLPHIFEPFFSTKAAAKGTGLGLSISYGIIKGHGGDVTVNSKSGQGSTFTVTLPLSGE